MSNMITIEPGLIRQSETRCGPCDIPAVDVPLTTDGVSVALDAVVACPQCRTQIKDV